MNAYMFFTKAERPAAVVCLSVSFVWNSSSNTFVWIIFLYFLFEHIQAENPEAKVTEISKILGKKWSELSEAAKKPFKDQSDADKERYVIAIADYKANKAPTESDSSSDSD